jgi:hypothetical protein
MNIDQMHDVDDTSSETLARLCALIAASHSDEHLVYREIEIDELWRLLSIAKKLASGAERGRIEAAMAVVMRVHDLIGIDGDTAAAAAVLRGLII